MKRKAAAIMMAVVVCSCGLLSACGGSAKTASFATVAEARSAIDQGWIPVELPPRAYELRAAYVPDGWQRWGIINFREDSAAELRDLLQPAEISLAGIRCDVPPRIEWWPVLLRQDLDAERITATGAKAYRGRSANVIWLINWRQGRAYYWTTGP